MKMLQSDKIQSTHIKAGEEEGVKLAQFLGLLTSVLGIPEDQN